MPLHLEDHLDAAIIVGLEVPADIPEPIEWRFDEAQPDGKALPMCRIDLGPTQLSATDDALRVTLGVLRDDFPFTFRISAGGEDGQPERLLEKTSADKDNWVQHSVDRNRHARLVTGATVLDSPSVLDRRDALEAGRRRW